MMAWQDRASGSALLVDHRRPRGQDGPWSFAVVFIACLQRSSEDEDIQQESRGSVAADASGNVGIAKRFPRAVGRAENLLLVFRAFHLRVISTVRSVSGRLCSFPLSIRRSAEAIRFCPGLQDVSPVRNAIQ
jgi:hypothetical protein